MNERMNERKDIIDLGVSYVFLYTEYLHVFAADD